MSNRFNLDVNHSAFHILPNTVVGHLGPPNFGFDFIQHKKGHLRSLKYFKN